MEELIEDIPEKSRKPLAIIAALFVALILIISFIPLYSISVNPPPDLDKIKSFELTDNEKLVLERISYNPTGSIENAISQVDVFDYRILTNRLVSSACSSTSDLCYAKAVYYYVQGLQYVSDPESRQYVQSPAETLLSGAGDCEDFSLLYSAMMESVGVDADIGVTSNHAFARIKASGSFFSDDYTWVDPTSSNEFGEVSFLNSDVVGWIELV